MPSDRGRGERGVSVVEVVVTLALLSVILAIFSSQMVFDRVHTASQRSESNDSVRLAIQELDRQVRSGNVIHDPGEEVPAGMSLRVYTQSNARTATEESRCVIWRIVDGRLETRAWSTLGAWLNDWRVVAEHLRNSSTTDPPSPAFAFDQAQTGFGQRIVQVSLLVNRDEREGRDVEVRASLTGRNVQFGHPQSLCENVPEET